MTVEAAIAVGTLVLVAAAVIAAVASVLASVRCVDAARELARAAARGDTDRGRALAARIAPTGATLDVRVDGESVVVVVASEPVGLLPLTVSGTATGLMEPGVVRAVTPPVPDSPPGEDAVPDVPAPGAADPRPSEPDAPTESGPAGPDAARPTGDAPPADAP